MYGCDILMMVGGAVGLLFMLVVVWCLLYDSDPKAEDRLARSEFGGPPPDDDEEDRGDDSGCHRASQNQPSAGEMGSQGGCGENAK